MASPLKFTGVLDPYPLAGFLRYSTMKYSRGSAVGMNTPSMLSSAGSSTTLSTSVVMVRGLSQPSR